MAMMERPDERKALEILQKAEPEKYQSAILLDKPDIQNPKQNIGVEVTQSLKESVLKALQLDAINVHNDEQILEIIKEKYGNEVLRINLPLPDNSKKEVAISIANWHSLFNLIEAYDNKAEKLQSGNYKIYKENNLFIFVFGEGEKSIEQLAKHIYRKRTKQQYDFIYVYSQPNLYKIDRQMKIVVKRVPI
ncbi:hypothetical protein [Enterococcus caccae]|uniref:Uncharacterized protein n=1 Tax=Enterococcus caccae ATCC BAA-1240 TaxID=1158612 RepID=R3WSA1_9ENTE|nr:hypothetical protein [Enterococcus caccae]EOL50741.1 hypothetical protein UC7_00192 [Enterococcus caccae ATCC BAA-1240]EOT59366.1 hypothetical protein I580_02398 [Enterococcus caccae ATCC BAA-1240]OJG27727.1 hypothetical protein RU98_GL002430 [Enterococcus caccae]